MQINTLKRKVANKASRQVARGGTRGKTAGKGTKGQNARSGRKKRPEIRDTIKLCFFKFQVRRKCFSKISYPKRNYKNGRGSHSKSKNTFWWRN